MNDFVGRTLKLEAVPKKPYRKPRVEEYGSVIELTKAGAGTVDDGGGGFTFSGAAG